jgi:hypothetical protein
LGDTIAAKLLYRGVGMAHKNIANSSFNGRQCPPYIGYVKKSRAGHDSTQSTSQPINPINLIYPACPMKCLSCEMPVQRNAKTISAGRSLFLWDEAYFIGVKYRQISLPNLSNEIFVALISSG